MTQRLLTSHHVFGILRFRHLKRLEWSDAFGNLRFRHLVRKKMMWECMNRQGVGKKIMNLCVTELNAAATSTNNIPQDSSALMVMTETAVY